jgi:hypothetical protein
MSNSLTGRIGMAALAAAVLLVAGVLLSPVGSISQEVVPFKLPGAQVPNYRTIWLGVLQGTWTEMGIQYGERCAPDIRRQFEKTWEGQSKANPRVYGDMTEQQRNKYMLDYIELDFKEVSYLCPEMIEFMQGIAKGAESELNKSKYANLCSNFMKICITTAGWEGGKMHPATSPYYYAPKKAANGGGAGLEYDTPYDSDCHWFYLKGKATTDGNAIAMSEGTHTFDDMMTVAYVAIPKDPKAHVYYGFGWPGQVGGSGGAAFNENGVALMTSGTQSATSNAQADETLAPGIPDLFLGYPAVIFSNTAKEAADYVTIGTPEYRAKTGRKTVLRRRGSNLVFADAKECYDVEQNARHYAIRKPGYLGETNGDFMAGANHFMYKDGSYDEENVWNPSEPMTKYDPEVPGSDSSFRMWSCFWEIKNRYGKINKDVVLREIMPSHTAYDKDGKAYPPDAAGAPTKGSVCYHSGPRTKENPLGTGGSAKIRIFIPSKLEVYWVEAWPCAYQDKTWNSVSLKPFSEYRKLLLGRAGADNDQLR